jgi:RNA 3'-phosphate cyclase
MIEIDGSEGGGQILRTAVAMSAITKEPVRVFNIRKGKEGAKPGLRLQHLTGIQAVGEFSNADVRGLEEGSMEIEFHPRMFGLTDKRINIGSAGSISLLLQTLIPTLAMGDRRTKLQIIGGTETRWSPTMQYLQNVTLKILKKMGIDINVDIVKHGFYPKGGGIVDVYSRPGKIRAIKLVKRGELKGFHVESVAGDLPEEIAKRQAESAVSIIRHNYPDAKISMAYKKVDSASSGTSVTCTAVFENTVLGGSALGARGIKAEQVGIDAADDLLDSVKSKACLDRYMADQILPFMALAKGDSEVSVSGITHHCINNIKTIEKMLPVKFEVNQRKTIKVKGIGK